VISDVSPDGVAHPISAGRLRTAYPDIDLGRSLRDPVTGAIVQPYNVFDQRRPAAALSWRKVFVEFWPIGNRFRRGHRIRLHIVGASGYYMTLPTVNRIRTAGSRLMLPVLPQEALR
jgi:hypothetical protein